MKMTDLEQLKQMFDKCGHTYKIVENTTFRLIKSFAQYVNIECTEMTVQGHFYDELSVFFNEKGDLLEMQSHLIIGHPQTKATKKLMGGIKCK